MRLDSIGDKIGSLAAQIQVLDYGSGNLFSIQNSLERLSKDSREQVNMIVDSRYRSADEGDALVLPGVGSFPSAQRILSENKEAILRDVREKKMPLLGICLGMQLLFESSEEGPGEGLKFFRGSVKRFVPTAHCKVPHMGWNTMNPSQSSPDRDLTLCAGIGRSEWVYYVHSYFPEPYDSSIVEAWSEYAGTKFPAVVSEGSVFGTQFHPEKSHTAGSRILSNFLTLALERR